MRSITYRLMIFHTGDESAGKCDRCGTCVDVRYGQVLTDDKMCKACLVKDQE